MQGLSVTCATVYLVNQVQSILLLGLLTSPEGDASATITAACQQTRGLYIRLKTRKTQPLQHLYLLSHRCTAASMSRELTEASSDGDEGRPLLGTQHPTGVPSFSLGGQTRLTSASQTYVTTIIPLIIESGLQVLDGKKQWKSASSGSWTLGWPCY